MKIALDTRSFLDPDTGKPLEGRLSIYLRDSDTLATVYTLEGNDFVQAENPLLVHNGETDTTLYADAAIYRLKLERYTGPEGQMAFDADPAYFEQADIYGCGLDWSSAIENTNQVGTISDLQDVDPDLGAITVLGYYTKNDCFPRTYIWDEDSVDQPDGGYVIGSNVSDTGNWILLWGSETLPCQVYGVFPGSEANLNGLLGYSNLVGSFAEKTAPCVRFIAGTYTSISNITTDKELVFDGGAKFTDATITCPRIRVVGYTNDYIGDFTLTAKDSVAHSSWFRTLYKFWTCGARFLEMDAVNFFADNVIRGNVSLSNRVVTGTGRIPCTYDSGAYFMVAANTTINGRIFSATIDYVRILGTGFGDGIFDRSGAWDPGLISEGHHIQYDQVPDLDLFEDAGRWVATMVERRARLDAQAWGDFILDLQNRRLDNVNTGKFTEIRNGTFNRLTILGSTMDVTLRNVTAADLTFTGRYLDIYDADVTFSMEPTSSAIWGYGSRIMGGTWTSPNLQIMLERCHVGITFRRVTENDNDESLLRFTECDFQENAAIQTKRLEMYRCMTRNNPIQIYPYKLDGAYHLGVILEGNTFDNSTPIEFTRIEEINGRWQEDVYNILLDWTITGNSFAGNDEGLRMRYWQKRGGQYYTRTFVRQGQGHNIQYSGNTGKCPAENMRGAVIPDGQTYVTETVAGTMTVYKYQNAAQRCMMNPINSWWGCRPIGGPNTLVKYYSQINEPYDSLSYDLFIQASWFSYPRAHDEAANDGDFFLLAILLPNDYLRIVQSGHGDHNEGIVGNMI